MVLSVGIFVMHSKQICINNYRLGEQIVSVLYASSSKCFFNEDKPLLAETADLFKVYINISRAY